MKIFKSVKPAVALLAAALTVFLAGGCNKTSEMSKDLIGDWGCEFEEEDWGGTCTAEYSFQKDGTATINIACGDGDKYSVPVLWHTEGNKIYFLQADDESIYEEEGLEWPNIEFKVTGGTLEFYYEGEMIASFVKKN